MIVLFAQISEDVRVAVERSDSFNWRDAADYGLPMIILTVVGVGAWKTISWVRDRIATPLVASHLKMIETLQNNSTAQTVEQIRQTEALNDIKEEVKQNTQEVRKHTEWAKKQVETLCKYNQGKQ